MGLGYALSDAAILTTDLDEAQRLVAEADELLRASGAPMGIAHTVEWRGIIAYDRGELADAAAFVAEAIEIFSSYGNVACCAHALDSAAVIVGRDGQLETATELLSAADEFRRRSGVSRKPWESRARYGIEDHIAPLSPVAHEAALTAGRRRQGYACGDTVPLWRRVARLVARGARLGAIHLPFSTAYKPAELRKSLRHGDVALLLAPNALFGADHRSFVAEAIAPLVASDGRQPPAPELPYLRDVWFGVDGDGESATDAVIDAMAAEVAPADLAVAIFTSGTTSEPKGVLHTHGALVRKGAHLAALQEWTVDDRIFCGMPFFWVGGLAMTVVPAFHVGATLLCVDRTDPDRSLDLVRRETATKLTGWPGVIGPILAAATEDDAAVPALGQHFAIVGARHSSLGMTETLASYTYTTPAEQAIPLPEGRTGSMGWLIDGAEVKVVDPVTQEHLPDGVEGVILVRGYFLTAGIVKRERSEVFTPDGFYNTGDKGCLVGDQLFLTGRVTEVARDRE